MQSFTMVRAAVLFSILLQTTALSTTSEGQAWLRSHTNPSVDELAELKSENPEAYGIVKALLTKRSLGLLDPKHPTASFSSKAAPLADDARGPDAFAKFASTPSVSVEESPSYSEAPVAHKHRDFFNWKPPQSGVDDDQAAVNNVLGAVAAVVQSKPAVSATPQAVVQTKAVNTPAPVEENSYLKGLDLGDKPSVQTPKASPEDNRYLRGSGLEADAPVAHKQDTSSAPQEDLLTTFSWSDEATPKKPQRKGSFTEATSRVSTNSASATQGNTKPGGNLFAWLDGKNAPTKPRAKAVVTTAKPENPYIMDLD